MRRVLTWAVILIAAAAGALALAGWYLSDELLRTGPQDGPEAEVPLAEVDPDRGLVRLAADAGELTELRTVGLVTDGALLLLHGPPQDDPADDTTERRADLLDGSWPEAGELAHLAVDTFAGSPDATLGIPLETVGVPSELGDLPAWRVVPPGAASEDTWTVIVNGTGSTRAEGNRLLPTLRRLRLPSLSISLRNSPDAPATPDGLNRFGTTEWRDLQAALDHLDEVEDARRFVLVGLGQGAASALEFLRRSDDADAVDAAVLISPLVSLDAVWANQIRDRGLPEPMVAPLLETTRRISQLRAELPRDAAEHLQDLDELPAELPMLVTHGEADAVFPVEPTRELAEGLGEQVAYEEYRSVGHLQEWNADPERFEEDLYTFLDRVVR
ncbi:MAG: alpha/beta hydrolase family protein [Actinomycetota bacterium]